MKFEQRTLQILKNYSTINPSLQFNKGEDSGSTLVTISPNKTVMAKAQIKEVIPSDFAIYDLSRFLGVLSLFDSPDVILGSTHLVISENGKNVQYTYADPKMIAVPSSKEIKLPDAEITFSLESTVLQSITKAMGVLGLPEIAVTGEQGKIKIQAIDSKNPTSDAYSIDINTNTPVYKVDSNATFRMIFLAENIKILPENYTLTISSKGIAHFVGKDIQYWVATESSSTYKS